ncbi:hypothetical protein FS749_000921 [Ceratobasidium sp. UAMH 11750]|nr:hypothetical protein FS749_000921 [Ceratobasidium sp. UAMH 11750]
MSRLELRRRTGTVMNMISKAISLYAQRQGDEDEQSDDKEQEEDDEEECMQVDKAVACLKKERRQLISKECPHVTQCKKEVIQLWNQYLDCLDRGSPLYAATAEFKPAEQNIGRIEKFNKYSELSKAKRKKAETDSNDVAPGI